MRLLLLILVLGACSSKGSPHAAPEQSPPPTAAKSSPAADPAASGDDALVAELAAIVVEQQARLTQTLTVMEDAHGDCAKAAAGLLAMESDASAALQRRMAAFQDKARARPELKPRLQEVMLKAFPAELRDRADSIIDPMERACAKSPEFQDAVKRSGYPKQAP